MSTDDNLKLPKEIEAYCKDEDKDRELEEKKYPCVDCGKLRTAGEGGTTFTVCDECWDKSHKKPTSNVDEKLRDILSECGLDAPDEEEIQKAMGLIKALYKPIGRYKLEQIIWDEIQCAIQDCLGLKEGAEEEIEEMLGGVESKIADAIINAGGER